jgi:ADP-glucose type glycogen/starch synthase
VLPGYPALDDGVRTDAVTIAGGGREDRVAFHRNGMHEGVDVWSVHHGVHFRAGCSYGYAADVEPFLVFSGAVAELARRWRPDVVHAHDWHPALALERLGGGVLTIHNLAYQGPLREPGDCLLARGIAAADAVTTVSERYREEILTPERGEGLDALLRSRRGRLRAVRNGVDYEQFDPETDPHVPARYDERALECRAVNKRAVQAEHGLAPDAGAPLLAMVSRLVEQKGLDLVFPSLRGLLALGAQLLVVGVGEDRYERALRRAARRWPGRVAYAPDPSEGPARRVYAGADVLLAPSRFEPMGLGPLIALRYGAVPVVRRTGGLAETIRDEREHPGRGLGLTFGPEDPGHLAAAVRAAVELWRSGERWRELQRRGMRARFSWDQAARGYEAIFRDAVAHRRPAARAGIRA